MSDLISDGALTQAGVDAAWLADIGEISGVEFSGEQVRVHRSGKDPLDLPGRLVATIQNQEWTWEQDFPQLELPELHNGVPASDALIAAARTLNGNVPILLAPTENLTRAIAVGFHPAPGPTRPALIAGLAAVVNTKNGHLDIHRALMGFAAARGLGIRNEGDVLTLSDGTEVTLAGSRVIDVAGGLSLADVRADARFFSAEHQLFYEGRWPNAELKVDLNRGKALVDQRLQAKAIVIATITDQEWTWAWADPHLPPNESANLRQFGLDHGIPALFQEQCPLPEALKLDLTDAAKPILGMWTHGYCPLNAYTTAVVLLDAPELHLPAPTEAAVAATWQAPIDPELDLDRAQSAYRAHRQIS
ncbi:hypothetical protein C5L39_08750 [Corynebacterium alimapuense]|uniref:Uncharacterized protein n=1 Tax=Corynebacterium alimapuense TaxID=1576874 RepID=A0A3M8K7W8_9CORY|nr:hypothetical protein C5L39_08750 [Corynebacterium alimapuense]